MVTPRTSLFGLSALALLAGLLTSCAQAPEPAPEPRPDRVTEGSLAATSAPAAPAEPTASAAAPTFEALDPAGYATTFAPAGVDFDSPSRDLRCGILAWGDGAESVRWGCSVPERTWAVPNSSPSDYCYDAMVPCGDGIEAIGSEPPHLRKRGDIAFAGEVPLTSGAGYGFEVNALQHGTSLTYGGITCTSAESGMTCTNHSSGHGFTVSKSAYKVW